MNQSNYINLTNKLDAELKSSAASKPDGLVLVNAHDLTPKPTQWHWKGWIAQGKLHLLAGLPGQGKTTIAMSLCATVTQGGLWPDGSTCEPGNVLIWTGEDGLEDSLLTKLMAAGADLSRCTFIKATLRNDKEHSFDPAHDIPLIEKEIEAIGNVKLIVFDPIVSAVAGDSHNNTEVRRALQPIVDLANKTQAAVLGITHFGKNQAAVDPTLRVIGSIAFAAVARAVFIASKLTNSEGVEQGIFAKAKANASNSMGGFEYGIEPIQLERGIETTRIAWGEATTGSAKELLAAALDGSTESSESDLVKMLRKVLSHGPVPATDAYSDLEHAGYTTDQVKRASLKLGVLKKKEGMSGPWIWSLPPAEEDPFGN